MEGKGIIPVILAGGSGRRLWPLSTAQKPKQFHALCSDKPLLIETLERVCGEGFAAPVIVANTTHAHQINAMIQDYGVQVGGIIFEPVARNTAPAIAAAASLLAHKNPEDVMVVLPSDHAIENNTAFCKIMRQAASKLDSHSIVSFGVRATEARTEYGYIQCGKALDDGVFQITSFKEKPERKIAEQFLQDGCYLWNTGIYMGRAEVFTKAFQAHTKMIAEHAEASVRQAHIDESERCYLSKTHFEGCPSVSFDQAVMERYRNGAVYYLPIEWQDVGSWQSFEKIDALVG